ncbi:MAG: acyl carrier protein [Proteobacteria bacterium]|nr:MAG: acyl carrier protein [Pseudomonadota bacterium]
MQHRQKIKNYILENFLFSDDNAAIGDEESLIESGVMDSTGFYELIMFLEEEFSLVIKPEEMVPVNFDSIQTVDEFVTRKLAA